MAIKKYHVSKQLFDKDNTTIYSAYINTSDAWVIDSGSYSIKIPCVGNTTYTLSVGLSLPIFRVYESSDNDVEPTSYGTGGTPISRITRGENLSQYTFTTAANSVYIIFQGSASALNDWINSLMLNTGSTALPYEPYGDSFKNWFYREYGTETETFSTLPHEVIGDGTALSAWSMKGNMQVNGTPTPQNPITPAETGDKTANLLDYTKSESGGIDASGNLINSYNLWRSTVYTPIDNSKNYTISFQQDSNLSKVRVNYYQADKTHISRQEFDALSVDEGQLVIPNNAAFIKWTLYALVTINISFVASINLMLNEGTTAQTYEPYGYKIPISFGQGTYTNYLAEPIRKINDSADTAPSSGTANRAIYKYVLTGEENITFASGNAPFTIPLPYRIERFTTLQTKWICSHYPAVPPTATWANYDYLLSGNANVQTSLKIRDIDYTSVDDFKAFVVAQYQAGTPITIWYILETATTETFTAPTIPTSGSPQSFDVDTTLKPSEVSLTYHGWHEHTDTKYTNP